MRKFRFSEQALTVLFIGVAACLFIVQTKLSLEPGKTPVFSLEHMNLAFGYGSSSSSSSSSPACAGTSGADQTLSYNGHCYMLFTSVDKTWANAKTACAAYSGSYLTSITASAEQTQITGGFSLPSQSTFIGFNDRTTEGAFVWDHGEAVSYTNWGSGQPDDFASNQDCAVLYQPFSYQWDDNYCTSTYDYICEMTLSPSCGNGTKENGEACDDADTSSGDGCSATCTVESGWSCTGNAPTVCSEVCGNGIVTSGEECDDGNTSNGDGCTSSCDEQSGWSCSGAPSTCSTSCGDGITAGSESCDDGNATDTDACRNSCVYASCGDGVVQEDGADGIDGTSDDEDCDTSGESASCDDNCTAVACGDQNTNEAAGEQCDDGNVANTDACLNSCALSTCGDGYIRSGLEVCEPPGVGTCASNCTEARGVGATTIEEISYASSAGSRGGPPAHCGNGILEPDKGESCDEGRFNGLSPLCNRWCSDTFCGDGFVQAQAEECEPVRETDGMYVAQTCGGRMCTIPACNDEEICLGGCTWVFLPACREIQQTSSVQLFTAASSQGVVTDTSSSAVSETISSSSMGVVVVASVPTIPVASSAQSIEDDFPSSFEFGPQSCGNGIREDNEQCDDGARNSDTLPDSCRMNCENPVCGDRVADYSEECDDGNDILGDGCTPLCTRSLCGNSVLEAGEECDDGARNSDSQPDSCSTRCLLPRCGDGILDASFGEACDQGLDNSNTIPDRCRLNCTRPHCGDGIQDQIEQCDDGNASDLDSCTTSCTEVACGNTIIDWNETCDDGNRLSGDGCSSSCLADSTSFLEWLRDAVRLPFWR
jgi:cysteine-rich repeat protein